MEKHIKTYSALFSVVTPVIGFISLFTYYSLYNINITAYMSLDDYISLGMKYIILSGAAFLAILCISYVIEKISFYFVRKINGISGAIFYSKFITLLFLTILSFALLKIPQILPYSIIAISYNLLLLLIQMQNVGVRIKKRNFLLAKLIIIVYSLFVINFDFKQPHNDIWIEFKYNNNKISTKQNDTLFLIGENSNYVFIRDTLKKITYIYDRNNIRNLTFID